MHAVVSEKGQITIPKKLRHDLGLEPGAVLEFMERDGSLIVTKRMDTDPVDDWLGFAKMPKGKTVDAYIKSIRGR